jgi:hypothetical protein
MTEKGRCNILQGYRGKEAWPTHFNNLGGGNESGEWEEAEEETSRRGEVADLSGM